MIDPITLNDIDESNEWLLGKFGKGNNADNDLVHKNNDLIWGVTTEVMGAEDPIVHTRSTSAHGFRFNSMSRYLVSSVGASSSRRWESEPEEEKFDSEDECEEENGQIDYESYGEDEEEF